MNNDVMELGGKYDPNSGGMLETNLFMSSLKKYVSCQGPG